MMDKKYTYNMLNIKMMKYGEFINESSVDSEFDEEDEVTEFPSEFGIGDPVFIKIQECDIEGYVRHVGFTNGKVRYAVSVLVDTEEPDNLTTFHNIDSVFVEEREGEKVEFEFDNYS